MYAITIEFRYYNKDNDWSFSINPIGCYENIDEAIREGNIALQKTEKAFKCKLDRFSKNGGAFGTRMFLVANLNVEFKRKRMQIFAKIIEYLPITINDAIKNVKSKI